VLVVDITVIGFDHLGEIISAFASSRYPAHVVALVDGPAGAASSTAVGAAVTLERPFHRDEFVAALDELLGTDQADTLLSPADDEGGTDEHESSVVVAEGGTDEEPAVAAEDPDDEVEPEPDPESAPEALDEPADDIDLGDEAAGIEEGDAEPHDVEVEDEVAEDGADAEVDDDNDTADTEDEDEDEDEDETPPAVERAVRTDQSFTDILKMGRQL
jgi:hypothetical protein